MAYFRNREATLSDVARGNHVSYYHRIGGDCSFDKRARRGNVNSFLTGEVGRAPSVTFACQGFKLCYCFPFEVDHIVVVGLLPATRAFFLFLRGRKEIVYGRCSRRQNAEPLKDVENGASYLHVNVAYVEPLDLWP